MRSSGEAMLQGESGSRRPGAYSQLVVDGGDVRLDGAGANEELFGDLGAGHSLSNQAEYFDLSGREPARVLWRRGRGCCREPLAREGVLDGFFEFHGSPL